MSLLETGQRTNGQLGHWHPTCYCCYYRVFRFANKQPNECATSVASEARAGGMQHTRGVANGGWVLEKRMVNSGV